MGLQIGKGISIAGSVQMVFEQPASPTNLIPPELIGSMVAGSTVTVTNGDWTGVPNQFTYTYAWQLDSVTVPGETANTFELTNDMVGQTVTATVTATNVIGSTPANATGRVVSPWGPGQWIVANTAVNGTSLIFSTDNYIWRNIGNFATLSRTQNGSTWANVSVPITSPTQVIQADNRIVIWKSGTNNAAYSSNDGNSWTWSNITVNTTTNLLSGAFDGANLIILRGDPASNSFVRSTDLGSSWSNVDTGSSTNFKRDIAYGNGVFMTVGDYTNAAINTSKVSSDGGLTWSSIPFVKGTSIAYGEGKFVTTYPFGAESNPAYSYMTTDNGNSWTGTRLPDQGWTSVVYADNHFIASEGGGNIIYSSDGVNWSTPYRTIPLLQAGSGTMAYLASQSILINGGAGYNISYTETPADPNPNPNQPSNVRGALLTLSSATVTWTAPTSTGGSPILSYQVQAISIDGGANVTQNTSGPVTSYAITGLTTGKTYYFNVAATNSSGTGAYTSSENTVYMTPTVGSYYAGGIVVQVSGSSATICSSTAGTGFGSSTAAQGFCLSLTDGGYTDWFMPSLSQMGSISSNSSLIGGYTAGDYWTTTTYNPAMSGSYYIVRMPGGAVNVGYSGYSYYVRAIRVQFF